MTAIVEGFYKEGKVNLLQTPAGLPEGRVRVILITEEGPKPTPQFLTYGKYLRDNSTLENFKEAEWRGDEKWDDGHGQ